MQKLCMAVVLCLCATVYSAPAYVQDLPDYPPYTFKGQIGGNPQESSYQSNSTGVLVATANQFGSFQYFAIHSGWDVKRLRFKYSCVYANNDNQIVTSPTYNDSQKCPISGSSNSRYVRAVRLALDGSDKDNYNLEYECWIGYFGQNRLDYFGKVKAGELCGHETGGAPTEWISKLQIYLRRK